MNPNDLGPYGPRLLTYPPAAMRLPVPEGRPDAWGVAGATAFWQQDNPMTLVIAAKAADGVVLVSDTRETRVNDSLGRYRDDAVKIVVADHVLLGIAGPGQWAHALLKQHPETLRVPKETADAAIMVSSQLHSMLTALSTRVAPVFPDCEFVVVAAKPRPSIWLVVKKPLAGVPLHLWALPLEFQDDPFYCSGISPWAEPMLRQRWRPTLTTREVAVLCASAVLYTAAQSAWVGPTVRVHALLTDSAQVWSDVGILDEARALGVGAGR